MEPMTPPPRRPTPSRRRSAAPVLLPGFFIATVAIVLAVVALDRIDSGVGDAGAFVLVLLFAGLLMAAIRRLLDEQTPAGDDQPDRPGEGSP